MICLIVIIKNLVSNTNCKKKYASKIKLYIFQIFLKFFPSNFWISLISIYLQISYIRHFILVKKSCIFKNLNLQRKTDRNFGANLLGNKFRHLKLYSNATSWLTRSRCEQKVEVHIFDRANLSVFATWKFTTKKNLNLRKQVFLLNSMLWTTKKPKVCSIFDGKVFI